MAIFSPHSSTGRASRQHLVEPPDADDLPPPPARRQGPSSPTPAAEAAPSTWVHDLPEAPFGPMRPPRGEPWSPSSLADLPPPPHQAVTEGPAQPPAQTSTQAPAPAPAVPPTAPAIPTAPAFEIATLELTLADSLNRELIQHHGGALPVLDSSPPGSVLQNQIERYGADLSARLTQLTHANNAVRHQYLGAMDSAAQNAGPGVMGALFVPGQRGNRGDSTADTWRFDPVVFTDAYAQAGLAAGAPLAQRAFAALHGAGALQAWMESPSTDSGESRSGHTLSGCLDLQAPALVDVDGHPNRERMGWTAASLGSSGCDLRPIALSAPPRLHDAAAVWFDARLGWVTSQDNIFVRTSFLDKAIPVVFTGVMTWATAGAFGIAGGAGVASGAGIGAAGGVAGAMTAGAAFGAIGSLYGGLQSTGRIDLRGMLRGALAGGLTAGIASQTGLNTLGLNPAGEVTSYAQRALAVTGQATLQGALQAASGGQFKDGFTAGLAQGLGAEVARGLKLQIADLQRTQSIDAAQAGLLNQFARAAHSAVAMLGRPDDPGHAFAMTFVGGLVGDVQQGLDARELQAAVSGTDAGQRTGADTQSDLASPGHTDTPADFALWPSAPMPASDSGGLRLLPASVAEFQASLQDGIDRAATDPDFNPATFVQVRLAELLRSEPDVRPLTTTSDDDRLLLAGPGGPRPAPSGPAGHGLQLTLDRRASTVFETLGNAPVGDAFGLIPEAYRDIKLLGPLLQESRLRGEIERMRTVLGRSGLDVTPQKLGAVAGIDANGRVSFDQVDLADRYANAIRLLELRRQGVIELDMTNFSVVAVGTARLTPEVLVRNVEERYQAAFSRGLVEAEQRLDAAEQLRFPVDMPRQLQVGLYADEAAKRFVRNYLSANGVPEGPGQLVALNRWVYDREGSGVYARPDVFIDFGPQHRHFIDGKTSFVSDGVLPAQLRNFFNYTGSQTGTVASRDGSISVRAPRGRP